MYNHFTLACHSQTNLSTWAKLGLVSHTMLAPHIRHDLGDKTACCFVCKLKLSSDIIITNVKVIQWFLLSSYLGRQDTTGQLCQKLLCNFLMLFGLSSLLCNAVSAIIQP